MRKEFSKPVLGSDKDIMMEPLSRKSRREAQEKSKGNIKAPKLQLKDSKTPLLGADFMSNLMSDSTGIVQRSCNLTNHALEKELPTSLDCFNLNANENGQLSFLDSLVPGALAGNE